MGPTTVRDNANNGDQNQVLPLLLNRCLACGNFYPPPIMAHPSATTVTVNSHDRRIHLVCALARGSDCYISAAVGSLGECQLGVQHQCLCGHPDRSERTYLGLAAAEEYMPELAGCFRVCVSGRDFSSVVDDDGLSGVYGGYMT